MIKENFEKLGEPMQEKCVTRRNELTEIHVLITVNPDGQGNTYRVYLDEEIEEAREYRNFVEFLDTANEDDVFELIMNGPGGYLYTCTQLIHSIANTKAKVIGKVVGSIASAHSNIFMACHEHVVYPYSKMMVHTLTGGNYGKGEDTVRAAEASNAVVKLMYTDLYSDFLSEEELYMVLHGNNDLYFIGQDIVDRLTNVYHAREEAYQDALRQAKLEQEDEVLEQALQIMQARGLMEPKIDLSESEPTTLTNTEVDEPEKFVTSDDSLLDASRFGYPKEVTSKIEVSAAPEDPLDPSYIGGLGIPYDEDE